MGVCLTHMVTKWNWHCTHFPLATCQVRINSLRYQWKPVIFSLTLKSCLQSPLSILPILPSDNLPGKSCIRPWHQAMISHHISPGWIIKTHFSYEKARACVLSRFSFVWLLATLWTAASRLLCPWASLGKNTGVGCNALLQGIFPTQGSNPSLFSRIGRWVLYH